MKIYDNDELWEMAEEAIYESVYRQTSYCDRPSPSSIDRMIEGKFRELLADQTDAIHSSMENR